MQNLLIFLVTLVYIVANFYAFKLLFKKINFYKYIINNNLFIILIIFSIVFDCAIYFKILNLIYV